MLIPEVLLECLFKEVSIMHITPMLQIKRWVANYLDHQLANQ